MRFNQFSYQKVNPDQMKKELADLGFNYDPTASDRANLRSFLDRVFFTYQDPKSHYDLLLAKAGQSLLDFLESEEELTAPVFYQIAFQVLGFIPGVDYQSPMTFHQESNFPVTFGPLLENLYQLLSCRTKSGNSLIDHLVTQGLIPEDNDYHFFNGRSLASFAPQDFIREQVYVETNLDLDQDGQLDLVKVSIIRPSYKGRVPAMMTASPYHQGVNDPASEAALWKMEGELEVKESQTIQVQPTQTDFPEAKSQIEAPLADQAEQTLGPIDTYTLNDYMLTRGFASLYVSGLGTLDSDGLMPDGSYQQIHAFKKVIDWLGGRATAYTSRLRKHRIEATWASGKVATTGLSYLGTLSNGLATTAVDGLEVIIAEAGISSWYDYYRENGLVTSPGGYPGEDFDSLHLFTQSRNLRAAAAFRNKDLDKKVIEELRAQLDRQTGDYNQFWQDRNYLPQADKVQATCVFTHGSQDWNVKPLHVYQMFQALPEGLDKHLFFHNGAHVYMNAWQSIDFRESINALLSKKVLGLPSNYQLPAIIWQDNSKEQSWQVLEDFDHQEQLVLPLGQGQVRIQNHYNEEAFTAYSKAYPAFLKDLYEGKAQAQIIDLPIKKDLLLKGRPQLKLLLRSSSNKGLLSAQLLDFGSKKRHQPLPAPLASRKVDNGRYFMLENLVELPFKEAAYRLLSKAYLNLQNRQGLLEIQPVEANEWMELTLDMQPSIYQLRAGDRLRLALHTTDFEVTIRDNSNYYLEIDLDQSSLSLPID